MTKLAPVSENGQMESCQILRPDGKAAVLLICDHASNRIPLEYDGLGLSDTELSQHIAWDIGAAAVTERLSVALDAPAILATFSRLLIDTNRDPESDTLIPATSDGIPVPGNQNMSNTERRRRMRHYYDPFHQTVSHYIGGFRRRQMVPLVIALHSFTPVMDNVARPWHAGMLWDRDPRLAQALIAGLESRPGLIVGDNEPYSGRQLFHTMDIHGASNGFPQVTVEIRQDEIDHGKGVDKWADILTEEIIRIGQMPEMQAVRYY